MKPRSQMLTLALLAGLAGLGLGLLPRAGHGEPPFSEGSIVSPEFPAIMIHWINDTVVAGR